VTAAHTAAGQAWAVRAVGAAHSSANAGAAGPWCGECLAALFKGHICRKTAMAGSVGVSVGVVPLFSKLTHETVQCCWECGCTK
jgi:hypothetical protein